MKKRTFALFLALAMLAGCAPKNAPPAGSVSSSAPQIQYEQVVLYLPNDTADGLTERVVQVEQSDQMAATLVQTLEAEGALPEGSDVRKWSILDATTTFALKVDLNDEFAAGILQVGTAGETTMLASLINTLWAYYEPDGLVLTVDGKPLETGHNIYDEPFTAPISLS